MFSNNQKMLVISLAALSLAACATQQNPAPIVSGLDNGSYSTPSTNTIETNVATTPTDSHNTAASDTSNPYGATPYQPNTTTTSPITPENTIISTTPTTTVRPKAPYIGNYSPVDVNAHTHIVEPGDTVYNISKRYGISQDSLRMWNNIGADNAINLGQALRVKPTNTTAATKPVINTARGTPANTPILTNRSTKEVAGIVWQSPTQGKITKAFGAGGEKEQRNSIYLSGTRGQPVVAAADGQVVYSGKSLRDYGNLIIIQHNTQYLTAYGSNEAPLMVLDGQMVKRGQQIARMGDSDKFGTLKLHFEIRKNGTPLNPTEFIQF